MPSINDHKERRASRRLSGRGASFKSKLKFVVEDAEADMNDKLVTRLGADANDDTITSLCQI